MRKLFHLLPLVGLGLAVISQVPSLAAKLPGRPQLWLLGGLVLVLAYIALRWEDIGSVVGGRQLQYGTNTAAMSLVVLGILGVGNWLVDQNTVRWDFTKSQKYTLSDQTKKVVGGLKQDLKVTHFFVDNDLTARYTTEINERLKEYQALSPHVKVTKVNARQEPAEARKYDIKAVPTLVFEYGDKKETTTNGSEQDLTNTFIKVTRQGKKTVCFVKGEGERDPADSTERGLAGAKSALERGQYATEDLYLSRQSQVPASCSAVVVAGPEKDLLPDSVSALKAFVAGGGKALVMSEPPFKSATPNLDHLLKEWNIEAGSNVVLELYTRLTEQGFVNVADERVIIERYPYHEITRDFPFPTRFDGARSMKAGATNPPGVTTQNVLESSKDSWAESDLTLKNIKFDEKRDTKGPVAIAAVATISVPSPSPSPSPSASPTPLAPPPEEPAKREGRVAAFGDVDFASNALIRFQGNENLLLNVMAWLNQDTDLISIRARDPEDHRLAIIPGSSQLVGVVIFSLAGIPGFFVLLGVTNWWKRR
jgi:ABC-type uncharacterized transport system involved in gliding motility auxiliary subunit